MAGKVVTLDLADVLDDADHGHPAGEHLARRHDPDLERPVDRCGCDLDRSHPVDRQEQRDRRHPQCGRVRPRDHARRLLHDVYLDTRRRDRPTAALARARPGPHRHPEGRRDADRGHRRLARRHDVNYVWKRNGSPIAGATSATYPVVAVDLGTRIAVTVTGAKSGFAKVSRTSVESAPVAKGRLAKGPIPTIKGKAEVGKKLRVASGRWSEGVTLSYRWFVGTTPVPGATTTRFKVKKAYRGQRISVKVSGTKPGYQSRRTKSPPDAAAVV